MNRQATHKEVLQIFFTLTKNNFSYNESATSSNQGDKPDRLNQLPDN